MPRSLLYTLMLAVFLDIANFFMPMPIYTPLFLHSSFLHGYSHEIRALMLGALVSCFGIAQLFSGPIFGELSDQHGRKKILLLSLTVSSFSCILAGISLTIGSTSLVFISRLLIGGASGTISVIFALAADNSSEKERAKNIGYISVGPAFGVILGPIIGGHLASTNGLAWFGYATPFYFMALLYAAALLLLFKLLPGDQAFRERRKIHLFTSFQNGYIAFTRSVLLRRIMLLAILFQIGTESFYLAAPVLAVKNFGMTPGIIGNHFLVQGVFAFVAASWVNKYLSHHFISSKVYLTNVFLLALSFLFLLTKHSTFIFYLPFVGIGIFGSLCWIHSNNLFSQAVGKTEQGFIMGISQASWSCGGIIGSILVGVTTAIDYQITALLPVVFEALSLVMAILVVRMVKIPIAGNLENS